MSISADSTSTIPAEARMKMVQAKEVKVLRGGTDTVSVKIPEQFIFAIDKEAKRHRW